MNKSNILFGAFLIALISLTAWFFLHKEESHSHDHDHGHGHGHEEHEEESFPKGPHGGRLLTDGDFSMELRMHEGKDIPPHFQAFFFENEKPVDPKDVKLTIDLTRINRKEHITFTKQEKGMMSQQEIVEPHSFAAEITAEYQGKKHEWKFENIEGRVELNPYVVEENKIVVETAGPAVINITKKLSGKLSINEDNEYHVIPRYPGVVKKVLKNLGDKVEKGEVIAIVESNESLKEYEVKSDIAGTIISKHITPGKFVAEGQEIYTVADLSTVWADLNVYKSDFNSIKVGMPVTIQTPCSGEIHDKITYISPVGQSETQSIIARSVIPNSESQCTPGIFITGNVTLEEVKAPVAIKASALQKIRDMDVVFIKVGDLFEMAPVKIGKKNNEWLEVTSGLTPGEQYVSENSYLLKADLGKSEAEHDH